MKKMTRIIIGSTAVLGLAGGLTACGGHSVSSGNRLEKQQQNQATNTLVQDQPIPHYSYSQIRQNLIELETARAQGAQSTTFFFNQGVADPITSCDSIGAPIPTTAQLSNPQQVERHGDNGGGGNAVIGQMDPDGIYTGDSSGTYVMCVNAQGKPYAQYWEGFVDTVFGPAKWDSAKHQVALLGDPSFKFTKGK